MKNYVKHAISENPTWQEQMSLICSKKAKKAVFLIEKQLFLFAPQTGLEPVTL